MAQVDSETLQVHYYYYTSGGVPSLVNPNCVCVPVPADLDYTCAMAVKDQDGNIQLVVDPEKLNSKLWSEVRQQRNTLLTQCDWTQLPDVPLTADQKALWVAYRQELRDVTNQPDPANITWPVPPQ
jgi:Phage tail assembly chaperone protein